MVKKPNKVTHSVPSTQRQSPRASGLSADAVRVVLTECGLQIQPPRDLVYDLQELSARGGFRNDDLLKKLRKYSSLLKITDLKAFSARVASALRETLKRQPPAGQVRIEGLAHDLITPSSALSSSSAISSLQGVMGRQGVASSGVIAAQGITPDRGFVSIPGVNLRLRRIPSNGDNMQRYFLSKMSQNDALFFQLKLVDRHREAAILIGDEHPEILDPTNNSFNNVSWLYHRFILPQQEWADEFLTNGQIAGSRIIPFLEGVIRHIPGGIPGVNLEEISRPERIITREDNNQIGESIYKNVLLPLNLVCTTSPHGHGMGVIIPQLTEEIEANGLRFKVHRLYTLEGEFGEGMISAGNILIPIEHQIYAEVYHASWQAWWQDYKAGQEWPHFTENPVLLPHWISMVSFARKDLEAAIKDRNSGTLAEEIAHETTDRYCLAVLEDSLGTNVKKTDKGISTQAVKVILKQDSHLLNRLRSLELGGASLETLDTFSDAIFEVEAKLCAIQTSPVPLEALVDAIQKVIIPVPPLRDDHSQTEVLQEEERYPIARVELVQLLTSELLPGGRELCERVKWDRVENYDFSDEKSIAGFQEKWKRYLSGQLDDESGLMELRLRWYQFLHEVLKDEGSINSFIDSRKLVSSACGAHGTQFLLYGERDLNKPNWRQRYQALQSSRVS